LNIGSKNYFHSYSPSIDQSQTIYLIDYLIFAISLHYTAISSHIKIPLTFLDSNKF